MAKQCVEQWAFDVHDVPAEEAVERSCFQHSKRHAVTTRRGFRCARIFSATRALRVPVNRNHLLAAANGGARGESA
ncbi:hypothetical protein VOI32_26015 [Paraburkholderia caribensis]|uniref:Uncharacterized protein n=1 Tax=Paraburkholderia caribensis TaxID=75105 RepID=A0ABV0E1T8_9BURK|nr:hypothetical protein [Paraburkholderia caribensis]MCO4879690.1 hypothetical protein [Paraburkholderia caribensis]PTB26722.1 hypothetical protein C9I56_21380 [Paraburkholderia caribensis]